MDNLAPPPYSSSSYSTSRLSNIRNRLRTLLSFDRPIDSVARSNVRKDSKRVQFVETGMKSKSFIDSLRGYEIQENNRKYGTTDRDNLEYLKNHEPCLPYAINTVHLQNPYKSPEPLEGYARKRSCLKGMYRSRESTLRPRHGNLVVTKRKEVSTIENYNRYNEKSERITIRGKDCYRMCLKKSELKDTVKQYCTSSTLHGLRYIGNSSLSILERFFWIIAFVAAVLTAAYFIWQLYQKWIFTPIIISLSPEPVSLTEIPFPSVTLCNMNNVMRKEADRINREGNSLEKVLMEDICNFDNYTQSYDLDEESGKWSNVQRFMINVSQSCSDMLYLCQWHQNTKDCQKLFNPIMTDEGICCNFNSVHKKHMFYNPHDWSDLNVTFPFTGIDWTPETGYDSNVSPDAIPWRPYGAGKHLGLTLVLDAENHEYYCSSTASVGFKMLLHNPVETPKIADFAVALTPGSETRVIITPHVTTASRTILAIPRKKRKCFFTIERKLKYYRTYTQRNCVLECEANFTQQICQCVQYYMPKSAMTPICGKKDDLCAKRARKAMELKLYDEEKASNELNITETPSCNCWPACFEINYSLQMSQSHLASTFDIDDIYVKKDQKYFVENMAVVHLFFVNSQFTKYTKNELFGFTEFLSSTGGLLGLFMGFSFLSLAEIAYFVTLRLWCRLYRSNDVPSRALLRVHPIHQDQNVVYPFAQ